ncbi:hypothetical protein [Vulcanisaeta sp. JCM 16161]|uniref:hypothetical protein n=1 Tax=Vulcanisaeta sp. JCM 16161 TaxID=1295372 RepID=UPI001FB5237C|nr:hypothetical protein [Vulcanisaeta sp. JCM 16161]
MVRVLRAVLDAYRSKRDQLNELIKQVNDAIMSSYVSTVIGDVNVGVIDEVLTKIIDMYDNEYGASVPLLSFPRLHIMLFFFTEVST